MSGLNEPARDECHAGADFVRADSAGHDGWMLSTRWTLVELAQRGESGSIDKLVRRYAIPMFRFVCQDQYQQRGVRDEETAQDIVQEVFLKMADGRFFKQLRLREHRFRSYLFQVLRHQATDWRRRATTKKRLPDPWRVSLERVFEEVGTGFVAGPEERPEDVFIRRESRQVLNDVIREIEAACERDGFATHFLIFSDRFLGGWSAEQDGPFLDTKVSGSTSTPMESNSTRWKDIGARHNVPTQRAENMCKTVESRLEKALLREVGLRNIYEFLASFARAACSARPSV